MEALVFNGLDASTGDYLHAPTTPEELARAVLEAPPEPGAHVDELALRRARDEPTFGVAYPAEAESLADAGWGIVVAANAAREVVAALKPLCALRREQAGRYFREFSGADGVLRSESKDEWLGRHGMGPGDAEPEKVPYYLLLVGGPDEISFRFQYELDVHYAVGRLAFDTLHEYASYAAAVVASEGAAHARPRSIELFGPQNPDDKPTRLSATQLVAPISAEIEAKARSECTVNATVGDAATKHKLRELMCGGSAPDLLFTASHGLGFVRDDARQRDQQGALVCQDWPGPCVGRGQQLREEFYWAAADVPDDAIATPSVVFAFACYGAGTPLEDDFAHLRGKKVGRIAGRPFVARLPQRLLAHPAGRTLAFIGHVERAWECSFVTPEAGAQRGVFVSTLASILDGRRVGHALEFFNSRYAGLSSTLNTSLNAWAKERKKIKPTEFALQWLAVNDARNYALVGDPAVRLASSAT